jgi:hypothetical protein
MSRSLVSVEAPMRNSSGVSQASPSVSLTITSRCSACFEVRMPPAGFMPMLAAGLEVEIADRLEHHQHDARRRRRLDLAGRGLDEVGAGLHGELRRAAHVVVGDELAGLEDDLEVRVAARLP